MNTPVTVPHPAAFHFYLASATTWCTTSDSRTLTQAIDLMKKERITFAVYFVPLPPGAEYDIHFYVPCVKGSKMVELVEYRNGRRKR